MLLKERIAEVICEKKEVEEQLRLIDHLQQLGIAYHFKDDIKGSLRNLQASLKEISLIFKDNLHATALLFRLLRENGFSISEGDRSNFTSLCYKQYIYNSLVIIVQN